MIVKFWYLTLTAAIWGASLPGIQVPLIGNLYPYRILTIFLMIMVICFKKEIIVSKSIGTKTILVFGSIILYGLVSLFFSPEVTESIGKMFNYFINISFIFLFLIIVREKKVLYGSLKTIFINFIALLGIGVFEIFSGVHFFYNGDVFLNIKTMMNLYYPIGPTFNTNDFALLLMVLFPFVIYYVEQFKYKSILISLIFLTFIFVLLNCEAKLIMLSFVIYIILKIFNLENFVNKIKFSMLIFICLILTLYSGVFSALLDDFNSTSLDHGSGGIRLSLMKNGLMIFINSGFMGVGVGSMPHYMVHTSGILYVNGNSLHNSWLEFLVEFGLICFSLLIGWFIYIFIKSNIIRKTIMNVKDKHLLEASMISIIIFPLAIIVSSSATTLPFIWILIGMIAVIPNVLEKNKDMLV